MKISEKREPFYGMKNFRKNPHSTKKRTLFRHRANYFENKMSKKAKCGPFVEFKKKTFQKTFPRVKIPKQVIKRNPLTSFSFVNLLKIWKT